MKWAFDHLKLVIEPGGAVALAAALTHQELDTTRPIVAIASGGNVDPDVFALALQR
jgi:threonine dehydratase